MSSHTNYPFLNASVALYQSREFLDEKDIFYHVFGEYLDERFYEAMVRFYFNLSPKGTIEIVYILTKELNKLKIPFHFKCLKDSSIYQRPDTGVLYLDKRYFHDFSPLLVNIYERLKPYIRQSIPLFTLPLRAGIGFAENPPTPMKVLVLAAVD
nr:T3SS effector HopA1 family protein [Runella rosea]